MGSTGGTTMPFGSGSGTATVLPTGPGSGSGFPGSGTGMPGSGSGWTGMPTMPPGGGYGYGDCAPGFLKVCPEMDGTCPYDSMAVCPAPMTMPFVRSLDRMMGQMGSSDGCECVPMVLMQMVMTQQEVMGRSLDRASEDTFEDEKVKVGKKTCTCSFTFTVANNGKAKGTGSCDKKCSGNVKSMTLNSATYSYTFGFGVKKGKVKVGKVTAVEASTGGTTMPFGSGSGTATALPTGPGSGSGFPGSGTGMPGSGSGWTGMPTMPPGGSGSGWTGMPTMPPGGGYGYGDCAPGFLKVCPEMDGTCPYDSMAVCPAPMTMSFVRSLDRMMGQMGSSDGCECVPMVLMQMVMTQQEVMGRSLDRASEDTFEDEKVKVGKKTCTCSFTFTVANN